MKKNKSKFLTLGILFAIATFIIYIINRFIFASAVLKDILKTKNNHYYKWRFGNVYYTKQGSGTPLLLIHDLHCCGTGYEWNKLVNKLAKKHTVYVIELLGCGRSDKPRLTYTNYLYVQLLCDFIKNVIGHKTDIIASGYSSSFVVMACKNDSELFGKLMFINPPSLTSLNKAPTNKSKIFKFILELPIFGTLIYNMFTSKNNVDLLFTENYYCNPFHADEDMMDAYYEAAHLNGSNSKFLLSSLIGNFVNNNIYAALKSIDQSIYIIIGNDIDDANEILDQYLNANIAIESAIIKNAKQTPHLEYPDKVLEQVEIFF